MNRTDEAARSLSSSGMPPHRWRPRRVLVALALGLLAAMVLAAGVGAVAISPGRVVAALLSPLGIELPWQPGERERIILLSIRLPRVVLGAVVGAALGASGAALQGAVRNPLADPGIVGVTSGAGFAAALFLVVGAPLAAWAPALAPHMVAIAAFVGGLLTTLLVVSLGRSGGRTSSLGILLGGIAVAAMAGAGTGLLVVVADDAQLRSITFWSLGSLGAGSWTLVGAVVPAAAVALLLLAKLALPLDRLLLGEREARHVGVDTERVLHLTALAVALAVGASVAACGAIGFVGLVVPHLLRGRLGPSHRALIPAAALGGALLLVLADLVARTARGGVELPIGLLTAAIGAPVLLAMIRKTVLREVFP